MGYVKRTKKQGGFAAMMNTTPGECNFNREMTGSDMHLYTRNKLEMRIKKYSLIKNETAQFKDYFMKSMIRKCVTCKPGCTTETNKLIKENVKMCIEMLSCFRNVDDIIILLYDLIQSKETKKSKKIIKLIQIIYITIIILL